MAETVRAAIYLRVSLDATGEGLAVGRQQQDCERIVRERGWMLAETYTDNSISAYSKTKVRPAYDRMVNDFTAGRFSALVCWDLDRLTRQPRQLEDWIDAAQDRGLRLVTANGEADLSTDGGQMYARIKAAVARAEMDRKGKRQTRAQQQRAEMGRPPRGVRATGYTLDGDVIHTEATAVREAYLAFASGASLNAIAAALSGNPHENRAAPRNVPTLPTRNGKPWSPSSVYGILRNPRYAGWSMLSGEIVRDTTGAPISGQWEPIVSDGTWLEVQRRLDDPARKTNRVGTSRKHLGSGIYRCGVCLEPVKSHSSQYMTRYRCAGHIVRSQSQIDRYVLRIIELRLRKPDVKDLLASVDHAEMAGLQAAIEIQRGKIARAKSDYNAELIDGGLYKEIRTEALSRIDALEAERISMATNPVLASILASPDPAGEFLAADLSIQRATISGLVAVSLFSAPRGRKTFDPDTVQVDWIT